MKIRLAYYGRGHSRRWRWGRFPATPGLFFLYDLGCFRLIIDRHA